MQLENKINDEHFINEILMLDKDLRPIYEIHIKQNKKLLAHVFFGNIIRRLEANYSNTSYKTTMQKLIDYIDFAYKFGDESVQNVISVSFLEPIIHGNEEYKTKLKSLMKPYLLQEYEKYEKFQPKNIIMDEIYEKILSKK